MSDVRSLAMTAIALAMPLEAMPIGGIACPACRRTGREGPRAVMRRRRGGRWQEDGTMVTLRRIRFA